MNESRLSQRHEPEILNDLRSISEESGISQVAIIAACIRGLKKTWDDEKEITFPFRVVPESLYLKLKKRKSIE